MRYLHYLIAYFRKYDIVFIERELFDNDTFDLDLKFFSVAKKSILDIDDAMFLWYPEKFKAIAENANMIIVGNTNLYHEAEKHNDNVKLLPTPVVINKYPVKKHLENKKVPVSGWTGVDSNIPSQTP